MKKIYSLEQRRKDFDNIPIKELQKTVGYIDVPEKKGGTWGVTTADDSTFECSTQEMAQILAGVEEIKMMLMNQHKDVGGSERPGIRI